MPPTEGIGSLSVTMAPGCQAAPEKKAKQSRQGPPGCHEEPLEHPLLKAAMCQALGWERRLCCSASGERYNRLQSPLTVYCGEQDAA